MHQFAKNFTHDFSYSFLLNIVNLVVKSSFVFILPKTIGVAAFGYWQLYFLYTFFIAFGHLGLVDGVYLKYGGKFYQELDLRELRSQFWILLGMGIIWCILLLLYMHITHTDANKEFVLTIVACDLVLTLPRTLLSVIFQMTGMIKQYAFSLMSESVFSFTLIMIMLVLGVRDYEYFIFIDLAGRMLSLCISLINAPNFVGYCSLGIKALRTAISNISVGIYLLLSNMVGLVVVASVRFTIESNWGIILFSKISLAFSIASVVVTATSAAGIVLFPLLKRLKRENLQESYLSLSILLIILLITGMIVYYPATLLLKWWLPKYEESMYYLSIVLPMTFFDTQFTVIGSNFLKVIRKERSLFSVNIFAVCFTLLSIVLTIKFDYTVEFLLYGLILQSILKVFLTTCVLKKNIQCDDVTALTIGLLAAGLFIVSNIIFRGTAGLLFYIVGYIVLISIYRKKIQWAYTYLKMN